MKTVKGLHKRVHGSGPMGGKCHHHEHGPNGQGCPMHGGMGPGMMMGRHHMPPFAKPGLGHGHSREHLLVLIGKHPDGIRQKELAEGFGINQSSTSELVFRLICRMGYFSDITKEGAECIYTGMMTDTGGFTYNSNNREIYFIISELLSKGIDKDDIYRKVYNTYSESRLRLMGHVLSQMKVYPEHRAALITLTKKEQGNFNYIRGDSEGFVNIPLSIKNVVFSCFLREDTEKPMIKVSLRSVGSFPCNRLATEFFNGGGHLNASGGEFYGTLEEAKKVLELALEKFKPLLNAKG